MLRGDNSDFRRRTQKEIEPSQYASADRNPPGGRSQICLGNYAGDTKTSSYAGMYQPSDFSQITPAKRHGAPHPGSDIFSTQPSTQQHYASTKKMDRNASNIFSGEPGSLNTSSTPRKLNRMASDIFGVNANYNQAPISISPTTMQESSAFASYTDGYQPSPSSAQKRSSTGSRGQLDSREYECEPSESFRKPSSSEAYGQRAVSFADEPSSHDNGRKHTSSHQDIFGGYSQPSSQQPPKSSSASSMESNNCGVGPQIGNSSDGFGSSKGHRRHYPQNHGQVSSPFYTDPFMNGSSESGSQPSQYQRRSAEARYESNHESNYMSTSRDIGHQSSASYSKPDYNSCAGVTSEELNRKRYGRQ